MYLFPLFAHVLTINNNHEAWVSKKLTDLKSAFLYRLHEDTGEISQLQNIIVREKSKYDIVELEVMELRKEVEDLRRENKDLSENLYVRNLLETCCNAA